MQITAETNQKLINSKAVLIIDDSANTLLRLESYLKKLGFTNIQSSNNSDEGLKKFESIGNSGNHPVVFLDYDMKSINGLSLLSQLLMLDPDGTIIIQSANEKNDPVIRNLIEEGAYEYLQKPIHFETLKKIIDVIESEGNTSDIKTIDNDQIEKLLQTSTNISLTWLSEYSSTDANKLTLYLKDLEGKGKIKTSGPIKDILCNNCESVKTGHIFSCPSCKSSDFKQGRLVEHYDCGYSWLIEEFNTDICPQCNKKLKAVGVDHKIYKDYYSCNDCKTNFSELLCKYLCLRCGNTFALEDAKWKISQGYSYTKKF